MKVTLFMFTLANAFLYAGERSDLKTVEGVVSCWQVLERTSPRPAVCGKCNLRLEGKKLSILTVENCPPYEVYKCQKEDGKTFFINTLGCKPIYK